MTNPYNFDDDIDDDLWNRSHQKTGSNPTFADEHIKTENPMYQSPKGMECPSCGETHEVPEGFEKLPRQLNVMLSEYFKRFEAGNVSSLRAGAPPAALRLMASIVSFAGDVSRSGHGGPLLLAVSEVVDEMSDGAVQTKFRRYLAEHRLLTTNIILRVVNSFVEGLITDVNAGNVTDDGVVATAKHMRLFFQEQVKLKTTKYRELCEAQGVEVNEFLLTHGRYETTDLDDDVISFHRYALIHGIEHGR